ncbi:MAG: hypothetical protein ETSY1_12670 [Candidatus Entotheonella factor]|uniref:DUF4258 domain-containing protein n=1 Tax=Entotheonella factor TaxID=1429438 RepID=W4LQ03_ENTF1|nr:DUF4258 domain-containing protein [Candidatus Entotheonella palauensis]ETX00048.1 MAG: hypothetical protein ETSY1_12670 [Candidatus Entotheonella factor]
MPVDVYDLTAVLARLQAQARAEAIEFTLHAQQEMMEEAISPEDVLHAMATGQILENYPAHRRGSCCLLHGQALDGRNLHLVCTTARAALLLITAYEPRPPKWVTPTQRRPRGDL